MSSLSRRKFMAATAGAATYLGTMVAKADAASPTPPAPPQVPLGKTGITMSRIGQGTGMHGGNRQSNHSRMGFEKLVALLRHSYERGITFFDMADLYGTHVYFREALRFIPRDKISILTKIWWRYDGSANPQAEPWCRRVCEATIQRFLHEISTDYLDIVLLHCMSTEKWVDQLRPYMDALDDAKAKGKVKAVGVSCHNFAALKAAAECPWVDVVLARINPHGVKMDAPTDQVVPVLRRIKENGKAVIGMKILGEGKLASQKEECIKFAQDLGLIDAMTIGFEKPQYVDEVLNLVGKYPAAKVS